MTSDTQLDFGGDADYGAIQQCFSNKILTITNCTNFADKSNSCRRIITNFLEW